MTDSIRLDARAAARGTVAALMDVDGDDTVVCYCGLREACPHWNQMTSPERRACSADKRMTAEYLWRHRLAGT